MPIRDVREAVEKEMARLDAKYQNEVMKSEVESEVFADDILRLERQVRDSTMQAQAYRKEAMKSKVKKGQGELLKRSEAAESDIRSFNSELDALKLEEANARARRETLLSGWKKLETELKIMDETGCITAEVESQLTMMSVAHEKRLQALSEASKQVQAGAKGMRKKMRLAISLSVLEDVAVVEWNPKNGLPGVAGNLKKRMLSSLKELLSYDWCTRRKKLYWLNWRQAHDYMLKKEAAGIEKSFYSHWLRSKYFLHVRRVMGLAGGSSQIPQSGELWRSHEALERCASGERQHYQGLWRLQQFFHVWQESLSQRKNQQKVGMLDSLRAKYSARICARLARVRSRMAASFLHSVAQRGLNRWNSHVRSSAAQPKNQMLDTTMLAREKERLELELSQLRKEFSAKDVELAKKDQALGATNGEELQRRTAELKKSKSDLEAERELCTEISVDLKNTRAALKESTNSLVQMKLEWDKTKIELEKSRNDLTEASEYVDSIVAVEDEVLELKEECQNWKKRCEDLGKKGNNKDQEQILQAGRMCVLLLAKFWRELCGGTIGQVTARCVRNFHGRFKDDEFRTALWLENARAKSMCQLMLQVISDSQGKLVRLCSNWINNTKCCRATPMATGTVVATGFTNE